MIHSAARDFYGPASELGEIMRDGRSARSAVLSQMHATLGGLIRQASEDDVAPLRRLLTSYSRRAASWSPTNWIILNIQRPNLAEPVTIREMRALGHQPRQGAKAAALLIPVSVPDRLPLGRPDPRNVVPMTAPNSRSAQRLYFRFQPCVYDLHVDTEGPAVTRPPRTETSRSAFVARAEKLVAELETPSPLLNSLSRPERAMVAVETLLGHYQKPTRGAGIQAALRLATFLVLEAEGIESPGLDLTTWAQPQNWKQPKHLLADMNAASALVRRLTEGIRRLAATEAREQKTAIDPQVLNLSDLALQAESGGSVELATLRGLWETTADEPSDSDEWESPDESLPLPPLPNRRESLRY